MLRRPETNDSEAGVGTVLVVDDTASARCLVTKTLGHLGFQTLVACNGRTALSVVRACRPDAVVTDLEMPRMGGEQLVQEIRGHHDPRIGDLPIIVCSSKVDSTTLATLAKLDVDAVVPKPVEVRLLIEKALKLFNIE